MWPLAGLLVLSSVSLCVSMSMSMSNVSIDELRAYFVNTFMLSFVNIP